MHICSTPAITIVATIYRHTYTHLRRRRRHRLEALLLVRREAQDESGRGGERGAVRTSAAAAAASCSAGPGRVTGVPPRSGAGGAAARIGEIV